MYRVVRVPGRKINVRVPTESGKKSDGDTGGTSGPTVLKWVQLYLEFSPFLVIIQTLVVRENPKFEPFFSSENGPLQKCGIELKMSDSSTKTLHF